MIHAIIRQTCRNCCNKMVPLILNILSSVNHNCHRTLKLNYSFEAPILGCMFVPMGGASYYEMFDLGNLDNAVHFSSLHNKQGYDNTLSMVVPFKHSTLSQWWGDAKVPAFLRHLVPVIEKKGAIVHEFLTGRIGCQIKNGQQALQIICKI